MAEDTPLQIPCVITKISTLQAGGWNITFHVPANEAMQVRALVGAENQQAFIMVLVRDDGMPKELQKAAKTCQKVTRRTVSQP